MAYRLQRLEGIPVLIDARELAYEEDNAFIGWVHKARRLSSINALRASADKADVRLERKLRYEFAKVRAKSELCFARDMMRLCR